MPLTIEMAHKKGAGSTKNGRDSRGKSLGVKVFGSQVAKPGSIIIHQRGTRFHPGNNVGIGKDHTIFSLIDGLVKFEKLGPETKKDQLLLSLCDCRLPCLAPPTLIATAALFLATKSEETPCL